MNCVKSIPMVIVMLNSVWVSGRRWTVWEDFQSHGWWEKEGWLQEGERREGWLKKGERRRAGCRRVG